jgi:nicotinamidase-related amidase
MSRIIFDIDTQNDLCYKKTKIPINTITNIEDILIEAMRNEIVLIGSVVAHENDLYGYCTVGTEGQDKISETMIVEPEFYYTVANTRNGIDLNVAEQCWQIVFEKQCGDIWNVGNGQPDNLQSFLRHEGIDTIYIIGNNYNDSVVDTISGLMERKYKVKVILDAISWNNDDLVVLPQGVEMLSTKEFMIEIGVSDD